MSAKLLGARSTAPLTYVFIFMPGGCCPALLLKPTRASSTTRGLSRLNVLFITKQTTGDLAK